MATETISEYLLFSQEKKIQIQVQDYTHSTASIHALGESACMEVWEKILKVHSRIPFGKVLVVKLALRFQLMAKCIVVVS